MAAPIRVRFRSFTKNNIKFHSARVIAAAAVVQMEHAKLLIDLLRYEPPERPGQKYKRTHKLRDSWQIDPDTNPPKLTSSGLICRVINTAQDDRGRYYATYVQGPWQVDMHKGRWLRAEGGENGSADFSVEELRRSYAADLREIVELNIGFV